jgi:hypothetical protein
MLTTIAASIVTATLTLGGLAAVPARAGTAVNWHQRTCSAVQAYAAHPTRARLETLVVDSFRVAPKYLGADIGQLYADVEGGGTKYVVTDERYIASDCAK